MAGDVLEPNSSGVICLSFENNEMKIIWEKYSENFDTLHGIDISDDGKFIFVSGRRDDHLHIFSTSDGDLIKSINLGNNLMSAGVKVFSR